MSSATNLRHEIESSLAYRIPGALSPRQRVEPPRYTTGIVAIDELMRGGLPEGALTELVGTACSGRSTVALSLLAAVTQSDRVCAWIDVSDALDPESAAASGVDLERLLWVRCGSTSATQKSTHEQPPAQSKGILIAETMPRTTQGGGSLHPRSEGKDMPEAISAMLHDHGGLYDKQVRRDKRAIGTPAAPNRPLSFKSEDREEQVTSDRLPPRRGGVLSSRRTEPQPSRRTLPMPTRAPLPMTFSNVSPAGSTAPTQNKPAKKSWSALDQALRTADLLLQAGGFSLIVLDLGSTPADMALRIPLATWFRFRAACERTRVSVLLLSPRPCARSSAELVVRLNNGLIKAKNNVMTGIAFHAETERQRFAPVPEKPLPSKVVLMRKSPQSTQQAALRGQWQGVASWAVG